MLYSDDQISAFERCDVYIDGEHNLDTARHLYSLLEKLTQRGDKLIFYQKELAMTLNEFTEVYSALEHFEKVVDLWDMLLEWEKDTHSWIMMPVFELNASESSIKMFNTKKRMVKLLEFFKEKPQLHKLCLNCINSINLFDINYMELMLILRDESFKHRHWKELFAVIFKNQIPPKLDTINFKMLIDRNIKSHKSFINQLAELARNQYIFEFKIEEIQKCMGNTQVLTKMMPHSRQIMILNPQAIVGAFMENKEKCENMLRLSEHLEAFLKKIYDVHSNISKLEYYFGHLLSIQELLIGTRVLELLPSVEGDLSKKDRALFKVLQPKYHSIFDDMKTRGLNMLIRQIEDEDDRKEVKFPQGEILLTDEIYLELNNPLRYPNHAHADMFFKSILSKIKASFGSIFNLIPRFLNCSHEEFCYSIYKSFSERKLEGLEIFFPEIQEFVVTSSGAASLIGALVTSGETIMFDIPISLGFTEDEDLLHLYIIKIDAIETELHGSMKSQVLKGLNFFLQNTYNLEKFLAFIMETGLLTQNFETSVKAIVTHDLSIILESTFAPSTREIIKTRLNKYLALYLNPLRKLNVIHFREYLGSSDTKKLRSLEHYVQLLVYVVELIQEFVRKGEVSFSSFFWQSKLKVSLSISKDKQIEDLSKQANMENFMNTMSFTLKNLEKFSNIFMISTGARSIQASKFTLTVRAFDCQLGYLFQPASSRFLMSPSGERHSVNLLLAMNKHSTLSVRGEIGSGRECTIEHLAHTCGRHAFKIDLSAEASKSNGLMHKIMQALGNQFWVVLEEVERAESTVLLKLAKIVIGLGKHFVSSGRKIVQIDKMEYLLGNDYAMLMIQSTKVMGPNQSPKIPEVVLAEFRCASLITIDLHAFIYFQLSELIYFDDFDSKQIDSLSRNLLLFFQLLQAGLSDKVFVTAAFQNDSPPIVEELLNETNAWRASPRTIRPIIYRLKVALRLEHKVTPAKHVVFKVLYNCLRSRLSPHQKDSLMLNYLTIFDPEGSCFKVKDLSTRDHALSLYSFISNNKMSSFSNVNLIEKVQALSETLMDSQNRVVVNFGYSLQPYAQDFNKLQLYSYALKSASPSLTGKHLYNQPSA